MAKQGRSGLSLGDRLVLLVAWVVTCGLVYVLGFYVGQATRPPGPRPEERVVRLPVTTPPPPAGQRPPERSDLTFYDALTGGARPEPPAAPPSREAGTRTPPPEAAPTTTVPPRPAPPPPKVASAPPQTPPPTLRPPAAAPSSPPPTLTRLPPPPPPPAAPPRPASPPVAAVPAPTVPPAPVAPPPAGAASGTGHAAVDQPVAPERAQPGPGGSWSVLANPTRDEGEAADLVYRLKARGYDASLVRVAREGDTWYRVRVGRYPSQQRAAEAVRQLREREGVARAFVAED